MKKLISMSLVALMLFGLLAGCGDGSGSVGSNAPAPTGSGNQDEVLQVAFVVADSVESIYNRCMLLSLQRLQEAGDPFEFKYIENVTSDNAESVMRTYAEAGYDVIIAHAGVCRDAVAKIYSDYPGVVFMGGGNDWETPAPNVGAYDQAIHEGCYVQGVIAGLMTETNVVGYVAAMPTANITSEANAYERGVKSVNPDCQVLVSYMETWYDPVKAKECTNSQISMGADIVFGERDGVIQACQEAGIYAMAEKMDQSEIAPDTVIAQSIVRWDDALKEAFELVREGKFENRYYTEYEGAMADGICEVLINENVVPSDIVKQAHTVEQQIINGELSVPFEP